MMGSRTSERRHTQVDAAGIFRQQTINQINGDEVSSWSRKSQIMPQRVDRLFNTRLITGLVIRVQILAEHGEGAVSQHQLHIHDRADASHVDLVRALHRQEAGCDRLDLHAVLIDDLKRPWCRRTWPKHLSRSPGT